MPIASLRGGQGRKAICKCGSIYQAAEELRAEKREEKKKERIPGTDEALGAMMRKYNGGAGEKMKTGGVPANLPKIDSAAAKAEAAVPAGKNPKAWKQGLLEATVFSRSGRR